MKKNFIPFLIVTVLFHFCNSKHDFDKSISNSRDTTKPMDYYKTIDEFVISTQNSLSFQNGMNVFISKPENDKDALSKGFKLMHTDDEQNGNWLILAAKDVFVGFNNEEKYRAVLYEYKNKQSIVLYREDKNGMYYFRIHPPKY